MNKIINIFALFTILICNSGLAQGGKVTGGQSKITWEELRNGFPEVCAGIKSQGRYIQKDACVFWSNEKNGDKNCLVFTKEGLSDEKFAKAIKYCYVAP